MYVIEVPMNFPPNHPWNNCPSAFAAVVLGASAGGLAAFIAVISRLPSDFPVPVLIVQHRVRRGSDQDMLVKLLSTRSKLEVLQAHEGFILVPGRVYVAPPNRHLLVTDTGKIRLSDHVSINGHRPSVDESFESLASVFHERLIVTVLSGSMSDGAEGIVKVKARNGTVLVQEPHDALIDGMPNAAIATGCADFVLPSERIADALIALTMVPGAADLFRSYSPGQDIGVKYAKLLTSVFSHDATRPNNLPSK